VPDHIKWPDYSETGVPTSELLVAKSSVIPVYSEDEIAGIREACWIGWLALDAAHKACQIGVTTDEIDRITHEVIIENDAYPSPLNYHNFPKSICTSINEIICHGIPDFRPLENGDIINCDISVYKNGFHSDLNETYLIGEVAESSKALVKAAHDCLMKAIEKCKPGVMYWDVGAIISDYIEE